MAGKRVRFEPKTFTSEYTTRILTFGFEDLKNKRNLILTGSNGSIKITLMEWEMLQSYFSNITDWFSKDSEPWQKVLSKGKHLICDSFNGKKHFQIRIFVDWKYPTNKGVCFKQSDWDCFKEYSTKIEKLFKEEDYIFGNSKDESLQCYTIEEENFE